MLFDKGIKVQNGEKVVFQQTMLVKLYTLVQKHESQCKTYTLLKINKLYHKPNVKWIVVKLPGDNIEENLHSLEYGDDF